MSDVRDSLICESLKIQYSSPGMCPSKSRACLTCATLRYVTHSKYNTAHLGCTLKFTGMSDVRNSQICESLKTHYSSPGMYPQIHGHV